MTESEYEQLIKKSLQRFRDLYEKREEIDVELVKLRQFMYATVNMVPDKEKAQWEADIDAAVQKATASAASLADSVRKIYQERPNYGYTVGGVREALLEAGFDFSSYKSNPLSSISTTLRRMVETGELETRETAEGQTLFIPRISEREESTPKKKRRKI
jgi:hypothetical protein